MTKRDIKVVKGIAILAMIFYHLFASLEVQELANCSGLIFTSNITLVIAAACHVCVPLFVFSSGYGLAKIEKSSTEENYFALRSAKRYLSLMKDMVYVLIVVLFVTYAGGFGHNGSAVWGDSLLQKVVGALANVTGTAGILKESWFSASWWYMGMAVLIIFLTPLLCRIISKTGPFVAVILGIFLPRALELNTSDDNLGRYLPVLVLGIVWAMFDWDQRITEYLKSYKEKIAVCILLFVVLATCLILRNRMDANYLLETMMIACIVTLVLIFVRKVAFVSSILAFLGKYSKYMWLLHTFIYRYWFQDEIYSLGNIWLIFGTVTVISLVFAVLLDRIRILVGDVSLRVSLTTGKALFFSAVAIVAVYLFAVLSSEMVYMTNDDRSIQDTISGFLTGTPFPLHQFVNAIITIPLAFFSKVMPTVNWWYLWSQFLIIVGMLMIHYCLMRTAEKNKFPKSMLWSIIGFLDLGLFLYFVSNISFTIVPAVLGTGIVAMIFGLNEISEAKYKKWIIVCSVMGYIVLLAHRKQSGYVLLCYILMAYLYYFVGEKKKIGEILRKFSLTAIGFLVLTVCVTQVNQTIQNNYNGEEFVTFNNARVQYMDYPHDSYEENPEIYADVGWGKPVYELVEHWCFIDENVTAESLDYISEESETSDIGKLQVAIDLLKDVKNRGILTLWGASAIIALAILWKKISWKNFQFYIYNNAGTLCLLIIQILQGRAIYRSVALVLLPACIVNCLLMIKAKHHIEIKRNAVQILLLLLMVIMFVPVVEGTFSGNRQDVLASTARSNQIFTYGKQHSENVYIYESGVFNNIDPAGDLRGPSNVISWGGSTYLSRLYFAKLEANGLENLSGETFLEDNVYFLTTTNIYDTIFLEEDNVFLSFYSWLHEKYGALGFVMVDSITDGVYVYHFVFPENETEYEDYFKLTDGWIQLQN